MFEQLFPSSSPNPSKNAETASHLPKDAEEAIKANTQKMSKMYAFPATRSAAEIHLQASKFGYAPTKKQNQSEEQKGVCFCCDFPLYKQEIEMSYSTTPSQSYLNQHEFKISSGVCLFFTFIKVVILYLFIRFCITDSFNIVTSILGTYCQTHLDKCSQNFLKNFSSSNNKNNPTMLHILDILNFVVILLSMCFFVINRKIQYRIFAQVEAASHQESNYTIFCKDIPIMPLNDGMEKINFANITLDHSSFIKNIFQSKIKDWFKAITHSKQPTADKLDQDLLDLSSRRNLMEQSIIKSITLCFDLSELKKIEVMREDLMKEHCENEINEKELEVNILQMLVANESLLMIPNQIKLLNYQQIQLSKKYATDSSFDFNLTHFLGCAFISFEYQHYRDYILREFSKDKKKFLKLSNQHRLKVGGVSQPTDIFWFNQVVDVPSRFKSVIISYLILIMVLTFSFGALVGLNEAKINLLDSEDLVSTEGQQSFFGIILTIFTTVTTLILNYGLAFVIVKLNEFEQQQTRSKHLLSLLVKTVVTQFINTAIIYYIIAVINPAPLLSDQGIVLQVSSFFITSAIIQIAINILHPSWLYKKFINNNKYESETVKLFQITLNKELEEVQFDIVQRYSYYLLQIFTSAFYSYICPLSIPILIVTFSIQYWVDKYNLFRRSSLPYEVDEILSRGVLKMLDGSILVFAIGNLMFSYVLTYGDLSYLNLAASVLALLYLIINLSLPEHLEQSIFGSEDAIEQMTYSQCMKGELFKTRYWTSNPGTRFIHEIDVNTKKEIAESKNTLKIANKQDLQNIRKTLGQMNKERESFRSEQGEE